jgi:hypothetical protein
VFHLARPASHSTASRSGPNPRISRLPLVSSAAGGDGPQPSHASRRRPGPPEFSLEPRPANALRRGGPELLARFRGGLVVVGADFRRPMPKVGSRSAPPAQQLPQRPNPLAVSPRHASGGESPELVGRFAWPPRPFAPQPSTAPDAMKLRCAAALDVIRAAVERDAVGELVDVIAPARGSSSSCARPPRARGTRRAHCRSHDVPRWPGHRELPIGRSSA